MATSQSQNTEEGLLLFCSLQGNDILVRVELALYEYPCYIMNFISKRYVQVLANRRPAYIIGVTGRTI